MENAPNLFELFGGITKLAGELDEPISTVSGWKITGRIPATKQPRVLEIAERLGVPITAEHIIFPLGRPRAQAASSQQVEA